MSKVVYEGWMVRYGRRKIGRSFIHMRFFVLENRLLAYYKRKPQDSQVPIKTLLIDGNYRVEDRGLKTHHGHMLYVLSVYNKKEKYHRITMAAFNIQEVLIWKEKIESVIDQHQEPQIANGNKYVSFEYKSGMDNGRTASSSDHECQFVWPRDLCYVRYWRRNDDGSYVVLFRSREHENCGQQPGYVRAHVESGGFNISPLKSRNGKPRTQVQHLMQVDLKGWGVGYVSSFQQHCLLQMLNSVAGLREWFAQIDERGAPPRIPVMVNMASSSVSSVKTQKIDELSVPPGPSLDQTNAASRNSVMMDEYSDEDEEQMPEAEQEACPTKSDNDAKRTGGAPKEEPFEKIDLSCFSGNLRRDDRENSRDCWRISDGNNFRVRSKHFCFNKTKIPAGKHLMDLVAVDWFKDTKRMDHVARHHGCAAQVASEKGLFSLVFNVQVPGSTHYSMVFYFVTRELVPGSLLYRFVEGDDEFRNSRLKLIPSVPKGSWIVRQSVGSTPCLLGKAVDCNYIRGPKYLEVDIDIGSSTVANGVLGLVIGVITTLVVDMAFLVQANTTDELPERLIGAVRVSHIDLSSAIVPKLDADPSRLY
ncbi:hypothetical protein GOBAR_AA39476 [Gossypium barbadense]|uniref:START domain-containing protein n=1 Tax=Gossypium barbadense TaxID=3634 RepID=A0A2P5VQX5_GOSBA|nr:hypothetical protein GOBAR_AA39476 [Gossypium barbadense]